LSAICTNVAPNTNPGEEYLQKRESAIDFKDPYFIFLIFFFATGFMAIVLFILFYQKLEKRYGYSEAPDDIKQLAATIKNDRVQIDLALFSVDIEKLGRKTYKRIYLTPDGIWELTVEIEGACVVAFQARLRHNKSWFMNRTCEGWKNYPKIIQPYF
jgi:hypothetical protein